MANLNAALGIVDRAYLVDNSVDGADARLCLRCVDGGVRKVYGALPAWIERVTSDVARHSDFEDLREPRPGT